MTKQRLLELLASFWWQQIENPCSRLQFISPIPAETAWYLWLTIRPGVYEIQLEAWGKQGGEFLLRYYPRPEEEIFASFSVGEQILRVSHYFTDEILEASNEGTERENCTCPAASLHPHHHSQPHETQITKGIPRWKFRSQLHPTLFLIGRCSISFTEDNCLHLEAVSQNYWKHYSLDGIKILGEDTEYWLVPPHGLNRNVPGWELTHDLFRFLIEDCCQQAGYQITHQHQQQQAGWAFYEGNNGNSYRIISPELLEIKKKFVLKKYAGNTPAGREVKE